MLRKKKSILNTDLSLISTEELKSLVTSIRDELRSRKVSEDHIHYPLLERAKEVGYQQGFTTGYYWPDKWEEHGNPGGPWVYTDICRTPKFPRWAKRSRVINEQWRLGWEDGHKKKLKEKQSRTIEDLRSFDNNDIDREMRWLNSSGPDKGEKRKTC